MNLQVKIEAERALKEEGERLRVKLESESSQLRSDLSDAKAELEDVQRDRECEEGKLRESVANRDAEIEAFKQKLSDCQDTELQLRQVGLKMLCCETVF